MGSRNIKVPIGSAYVRPPTLFERRGADGSFAQHTPRIEGDDDALQRALVWPEAERGRASLRRIDALAMLLGFIGLLVLCLAALAA